MTVAAASFAARGKSMRAFSLVLAALATGVPLFLLIAGLSIHRYRAIRETGMFVDLIPLPQPRPSPETLQRPPPKPVERTPEPAPAEPAPSPPVQPVMASASPVAPQPTTVVAVGTGDAGMGWETGGAGSGGDSGAGGGAWVMPARVGASWIVKPDSDALRPYNPPRASAESVTGQILLNCRVARDTRVADCRVVTERPRGYGFGDAALSAARLFRLNPPTLNGLVDDQGRVEIPVTFNNRR